MKLHYLVVALLATRVSATCIFGYGCDSGSASVQKADISVTNSGYSATQTKGNNNNSNNNNNNGYANKHGNNYILTAQNTGYTTVTVDGGTSGISAFPATTWNGPHLKTTTVSTAGPTNSNGTGINQGTTNSSASANTAGSTNTGAIAGGVVGGFALASIIGGGIFFFVTRRARRRRDQGNLAINISEHDFPSSPDTMMGSNTTPSSYNPPLRYDTPRRLVPQTNPHPPPIEHYQGAPAQNDTYAPPYQAEFGQGFEKPSEDTSHAGMWKPDVAESKPNV